MENKWLLQQWLSNGLTHSPYLNPNLLPPHLPLRLVWGQGFLVNLRECSLGSKALKVTLPCPGFWLLIFRNACRGRKTNDWDLLSPLTNQLHEGQDGRKQFSCPYTAHLFVLTARDTGTTASGLWIIVIKAQWYYILVKCSPTRASGAYQSGYQVFLLGGRASDPC